MGPGHPDQGGLPSLGGVGRRSLLRGPPHLRLQHRQPRPHLGTSLRLLWLLAAATLLLAVVLLLVLPRGIPSNSQALIRIFQGRSCSAENTCSSSGPTVTWMAYNRFCWCVQVFGRRHAYTPTTQCWRSFHLLFFGMHPIAAQIICKTNKDLPTGRTY